MTDEISGLPTRRAALRLLDTVMRMGTPMDQATANATKGLSPPDRALAIAIAQDESPLLDVQAVLAETRQHGLGRVVHSLLPGVGGFCAPVFDAQGRLVMGLVVLGSVATLDTRWDSAPASALLRCAQQLSADLGHRAPA